MKEKIEKYVGKKGSILVTQREGFTVRVNVEIIDYKENFGKGFWLVKPLSGMGQGWTQQDPLYPILDQDR